jgi:Ca-activated chloride channel family protein
MGLSAQEPTFQVSVNSSLLPLEAVVRDSSGRPVMDLRKDDFQIYENGVAQKISLFEMAETPRSIMLIFDRSASAEKQESVVLQAINIFMRTIRPTDRISVFSFSSEFEIRLNWTGIDKERTPKVSMGMIRPWSAVYETLSSVGRRFGREMGRRGVIMLTDGCDSDFLQETRRLGGVLDIAQDGNFKTILKNISKQNIPIYFVALPVDPTAEYAYLKSPEYHKTAEYRLGMRSPTIAEDYIKGSLQRMLRIAEATGGQVVPARLEDVAALYEKIALQLGMSYSLGYTPGNTAAGGEYRKIEVRVLRPGLQVTQSRAGYQP